MRFMQLTVILLCMLLPSAMAQDETKDAPLVETSVETSVETGAEAGDTNADTVTTPAIDETAETAVPTNPGKYQASEQISDDLSVSFPVDI